MVTSEYSGILDRLFSVVMDRKGNPKEGSYTTSLYSGGVGAIGGKVLEEAAELVDAAGSGGRKEVIHEAADLIFHTWVLLAETGVSLEDVKGELGRREGVSGLEEKAGRKL